MKTLSFSLDTQPTRHAARLTPPRFLGALTLLGLATLAPTVQAQTLIYNNGTFATNNAAGITASAIADDFVFSSSQTFDQARVWLMDFSTPNDTLNNFSGTLSWLIYNNNADSPGSVLSSGTTSSVTLADTGADFSGGRIFQADFSIPSQTLGAGTYWFRIKENGLTDASDGSRVWWLNSGASTGFWTKSGNDLLNPTTWSSSTFHNRAFQFYASSASAPEPGTVAFLALGGTLVLVKRRRPAP